MSVGCTVIGNLHVKVSYFSCLQVPTALPLPTALLPTALPPLDVSTVGASIAAALNSDDLLPVGNVLHAAVRMGPPSAGTEQVPLGNPRSESVTPEPVTPEPITPETFCQSATVTPETTCQSATVTPVPEPNPVELSTRGRKRKAVNYSTSAQESKKMHEARQASGYWMSSRG